MLVVAAVSAAVSIAQLWRTTSGYDAYVVAMLTLAETSLAIGYQPDAGLEVRQEDGGAVVASIAEIASYGQWRTLRGQLLGTALSAAWLGAKMGFVIAVAMLAWSRWRDRHQQHRHPFRREPVTAARLAQRIYPWRIRALRLLAGEPPPYRIAGVPWPAFSETRHTLVSGIAGAGRSVLIGDLVRQIRARGDRCVIYDASGRYTGAFFDPARDVLMNPLDARMPRWSPFLEARRPRDFGPMAEALIPEHPDTVEPFWHTAARQCFTDCATALWRQGETRNRALVDHLLKLDLEDLARAMEGAAYRSLLEHKQPKAALGVRALLTFSMGAMEDVPESGEAFSIRRWVERDGDGEFLFLASPGDRDAALRGLISMWLGIAVDAVQELEPDEYRRLWVIVDDVAALNAVPGLRGAMAGSGPAGGCFLLGVRAVSGLRDVYGMKGARDLTNLCGTRVVLVAPDIDTAAWAAEGLGCDDVAEAGIGVSVTAGPRGGEVTLTPGGGRKPAVAPSRIMRLANLTGYVRFPGPCPVARFRLWNERRPPHVAPRFVPRARPGGREPGGGGARDHSWRSRQTRHAPPNRGASPDVNRRPGDGDASNNRSNGSKCRCLLWI